ncbi:DUF4350 domain-containing protein [Actinoplanes sp. NPDC023714]|uniref:DUF4350 domain-containing protein n=1 Tax=Actinoplanes sp. NPDC023714 TaxID=3154322 RepID=UPI0034082033
MNRFLTALNPRTHRRMRIVLPFTVLLLLVTGTLLVHAAQQPDPGDPAYLNPAATGGVGSGRLAAALRARGTAVTEAGTVESALDAVRQRPGATLFVPAPSFIDLEDLTSATGLPTGTRIVVAGAGQHDLGRTSWEVSHEGTRWAADAVGAGCAVPLPGPAAVLRQRYAAPEGSVCFGGGLAAFTDGPVTVVLVGAADPFRNDRIGEHANEAFATTVLGGERVIWLSVHERENGTPEEEPSAEASATPFERPAESDGGTGPTASPAGPATGQPPAAGGRTAKPPLTEAFPAAFWATLALAALVLIALAAAAARRLGSPVAEPLPSRVPAHETMLGHAGLYRRARARGPSLDILRTAARRRLTEHLGLPRDATPEEIAGRAGLPPDRVREVLAGKPPATDAELVTAAEDVQKLVLEILQRPDEKKGNP